MLDNAKKIGWIFAVGLIMGGAGVHYVEAMPVLKMVADGWCGKPAFRAVLIVGYGFYNCQDAVIANDIQIRDAENSAADDAAIFADLKAKDQARQSKKGRRP